MVWEALHFVLNVVEVIAAIAGVLGVGLLVAMAGLWILPRILGVTEEPLEDSDPEDEVIPFDPELRQ
jgi:hypothetical protein